MKRILLSLLLFSFFLQGINPIAYAASASPGKKTEFYRKKRQPYVDFILETALPNGALSMRPPNEKGDCHINPYFACYAATALAEAGNNKEVKKYLDWHFKNLNREEDIDGLTFTIYDYTANVKGKLKQQSKNYYDSADSYAALFLTALARYMESSGDKDYIRSRGSDILRVTEVLSAVWDGGVTYAKPSRKAAYLMDNCEVYEGLKSAEKLLAELTVKDLNAEFILSHIESSLAELKDSLESFYWNPSANRYEQCFMKKNEWTAASFSPNKFYPDAVSQLFPIAMGVIPADGQRAKRIYKAFCGNFKWQDLSHIKNGDDKFYWGIIAYAAALMGDGERLETYLNNVEGHRKQNSYTLYNADAAFIAMACGVMIDFHKGK